MPRGYSRVSADEHDDEEVQLEPVGAAAQPVGAPAPQQPQRYVPAPAAFDPRVQGQPAYGGAYGGAGYAQYPQRHAPPPPPPAFAPAPMPAPVAGPGAPPVPPQLPPRPGPHLMFFPADAVPFQVAPMPPVAEEFDRRTRSRVVAPTIGRYIGQGWALTKNNLRTVLLVEAAGLLLVAAFVALFWVAGRSVQHQPLWFDLGSPAGRVAAAEVIALALTAAILLVVRPLVAGWYRAAFNHMRTGGPLQPSDFFFAFRGGPYYLRLLLLVVLMNLAENVGLQLLVFPGLIVAVLDTLAVPIYVDYHSALSVWECFVRSFRVCWTYVCSIVGFFLLSVLVLVLGALAFGVGLFVAIPVVILAQAYMTLHLVGVSGCAMEPGILVMPAFVPAGVAPMRPPPPPGPPPQRPPHPPLAFAPVAPMGPVQMHAVGAAPPQPADVV